MDASSKHSSSAATASLCFSHIQELWACLAWPDPAQAQTLGAQLSQVGTTHQEEIRVWVQKGHGPQLLSPCPPPQDLCEAALFYTELLRKKVDAQPGAAGEAVSEPVSRGGTGVGGGGPGWPPPSCQPTHVRHTSPALRGPQRRGAPPQGCWPGTAWPGVARGGCRAGGHTPTASAQLHAGPGRGPAAGGPNRDGTPDLQGGRAGGRGRGPAGPPCTPQC